MNLAEWMFVILGGGGLFTWASLGLYDVIKLHNELKKEEELRKDL